MAILSNLYDLKINLRRFSTKKLIKLIAEINLLVELNQISKFTTRISIFIKFGIWKFNHISKDPINASNAIKNIYYTKFLSFSLQTSNNFVPLVNFN